MEQHDDHFPPICMEGPNREPLLFNGKPFTWASSIQEGMNKRGSFRCPSAHDDEIVTAINPLDNKKDLQMSYGMYTAWSAYPSSMITNPEQAVLISETSNHGSRDTYDPYPYRDREGHIIPIDGFSIGWDVGNNKEDWQKPGMLSTEMPKSVSRLAFPGTKTGNFTPKSQSRHTKGIHVLFADGHIESIQPPNAQTNYLDVGGELTGIWRTR
jgi:prepilin-type processing-associated H-X9-DG protein